MNLYQGWNNSFHAVGDNGVSGTPGYQKPRYDDEGDAAYKPVAEMGGCPADGCEGATMYLLNIEGCVNYRSVDISISDDTLIARIPGNQTSDEPSHGVEDVLVTIIPPGAQAGADGTIAGVIEETMAEADDPGTLQVVEYSRALTDLDASGVYQLSVYGVYKDGERSEVEHISYEVCSTGDTDCDGVPDDGDNSGDDNDNPCAGGETQDCDDNCREVVNPAQNNYDLDDFGTACECNDYAPDAYPGALEICDGLDSDCDGSVPADEADDDGDGYMLCTDDCNDLNQHIFPSNPNTFCDCLGPNPQGVQEDCTGGIDEDCDGLIDNEDSDCGGGGGVCMVSIVAASVNDDYMRFSDIANYLFLLCVFTAGAVLFWKGRRGLG
ncbi:MAG: hypothetical protein GY841_13195 [FCB group bacterium]|nr:hypothetical protein [FCB group bacterium]